MTLRPAQKPVSVDHDFSSPMLTDQSDLKASNINNIMEQYVRTGMLPSVNSAIAKWQDNTLAIPLEQAKNLLNDATALFNQLPVQIRKLMQNDPTKLDDFIKNPDNTEIMLKYGMLVKKDAESTLSSQSEAQTPKITETVK